MMWWSPPKQRQKWGDSQILSGGNWSQIFFDLFYVAGAYNLGNVLVKSSNSSVLLYACGAGLPVMYMWFDKMYYDARFTTRPGHDTWHRLLEILQICFVATALSRIRPADILSHPCEHIDMFQFSASLLLNSMITIYRYVEVFYYVIGDPSAKVAAKRDIQTRLIPSLFLFAATIESGYYYFGIGEQCNQTNDRPIWYCLTSWISWAVLVYFDQIIFAPKYRCVEISVPMNVHFCVHRYGEWFMLMFGESIISLLIVDANNENINYSVAFYSGILSVILLAHLHFGSIEPHSIDSHALSRSRHSSYMYTIMVPIYSAALIAIGVSYKLFLYEFKYQNYGGGDSHRKLDGAKGNGNANDDYAYQEKRQQFAADLFSGSIATVLLCADFIQLLHLGLPQILKIARRVSKFSLFLFITLKYSLVVLLASLSTMQNDPHVMAFCGLGAFFFQEFLYNQYVFRGSDVNDEGSKCLDDATWHTVTTYSEGFFEDDNTILATFEQLEMHNCNLPVIEEAASKCERDEDASSQGTANGDTEDGTGYTTLAEI